MQIFPLIIPGSWLVFPDEKNKDLLTNLLMHIENLFFEANAALICYKIESQKLIQRHAGIRDEIKIKSDRVRKQEIENDILQERNVGGAASSADVIFEVESTFRNEKWANGNIPNSILNACVFIHAKSFLYSFDMIGKIVRVLEGIPGAPKGTYDKIKKTFPDLIGLRDTIQHREDRSRGLGRVKGKMVAIKAQSVDVGGLKFGAGSIVLNCLNNDNYGSTMADGTYGQIEISEATLENMRVIIQELLELFQWDGSKTYLPHS
ncbi:hypothetical protein [Raoultella ornithinolytica]|uniref:hypothetical protein n=1 Tax=Raoultella ornithinolytica TaxID=54291 RepID=UPI0015DD4D89|nr:hypothetical protein [Raoultella ornithinolytica]QLK22158.1 hypothetical protein GPJ66_15770 [Raoultella ornithinolytica]